MQVTVLTRTLTMAGALPIVGLGILSFSDEFNWVNPVLGTYVFGIVMFMLGTLWGQAKESNANTLAIASNLLFFIALCAYSMLNNSLWLMASAGILIATFITERVISDISEEYQQLRTDITLLVCTVIVVVVLLRQF